MEQQVLGLTEPPGLSPDLLVRLQVSIHLGPNEQVPTVTSHPLSRVGRRWSPPHWLLGHHA